MNNIEQKLLKSFSNQCGIVFDYAVAQDSFVSTNKQCNWFFDAIKDAAAFWESNLNVGCNDVNQHTMCYDRVVLQLISKLALQTMGFDINHIIALSGEVQEHDEIKKSFMVFLPYDDCKVIEPQMALLFSPQDRKEFRWENLHAIRKQFNLANKEAVVVCKDSKTGLFKTHGIMKSAFVSNYPRIFFQKKMQWEFHLGKSAMTHAQATQAKARQEKCLQNRKSKITDEDNIIENTCAKSCRLVFCKGSLVMPSVDLTEAAADYVRHCLSKSKKEADTWAQSVARIISMTERCEKGACLIFGLSRRIVGEAKRLTHNRRGMLLPSPRNILNAGGKYEITRMASVDGAILLDYSGKVYAYGVILDGITKSVGSTDRGARYNSTKTYIENRNRRIACNPFIGIVKSEDGSIDAFCQKRKIEAQNNT